MNNGKVKWWSDSKGYGFIELEGYDDIFVHFTEIQGEGYKTLSENQEVEFNLYVDDKGPTAKNVRKLK